MITLLQSILLDGCGGLDPDGVVGGHFEQDDVDDG